MMTVRQSLFLRLVSLAFGLAVMAMGIVICIRADLGITPISCPPYVLSLSLPPILPSEDSLRRLAAARQHRLFAGVARPYRRHPRRDARLRSLSGIFAWSHSPHSGRNPAKTPFIAH